MEWFWRLRKRPWRKSLIRFSKLERMNNAFFSLSERDLHAMGEDDKVKIMNEKIKLFKQIGKYARKKSKSIVKEINYFSEKEGVSILSTQGSSILLRATPCFRVNLDDAVTVLCNISFSFTKNSKSYKKSDFEKIVGQRFKSTLPFLQRVWMFKTTVSYENSVVWCRYRCRGAFQKHEEVQKLEEGRINRLQPLLLRFWT